MGSNSKYKTIMLIDDNEIDNLINQKMIESLELADNILVHSGAKSALEYLKNIEKIKENSVDFLPQFIFLDIDMPIMDGFQFLEEFSKMKESTKNYCKVIMLTSSLDPKDMVRSKNSQYIYNYINKPLSQNNLKKVL
jgi:CheY-like chemotaxis protein